MEKSMNVCVWKANFARWWSENRIRLPQLFAVEPVCWYRWGRFISWGPNFPLCTHPIHRVSAIWWKNFCTFCLSGWVTITSIHPSWVIYRHLCPLLPKILSPVHSSDIPVWRVFFSSLGAGFFSQHPIHNLEPYLFFFWSTVYMCKNVLRGLFGYVEIFLSLWITFSSIKAPKIWVILLCEKSVMRVRNGWSELKGDFAVKSPKEHREQ